MGGQSGEGGRWGFGGFPLSPPPRALLLSPARPRGAAGRDPPRGAARAGTGLSGPWGMQVLKSSRLKACCRGGGRTELLLGRLRSCWHRWVVFSRKPEECQVRASRRCLRVGSFFFFFFAKHLSAPGKTGFFLASVTPLPTPPRRRQLALLPPRGGEK